MSDGISVVEGDRLISGKRCHCVLVMGHKLPTLNSNETGVLLEERCTVRNQMKQGLCWMKGGLCERNERGVVLEERCTVTAKVMVAVAFVKSVAV